MDSGRWAHPRSKSAFDLSTASYDVTPGLVPEKKKESHSASKADSKRSRVGSLQPPQVDIGLKGATNFQERAQKGRRLSLVEKAMNSNLKEDIKKLWARRSSLNLFKSSPKSPASDEEELKTSLESLDCLMQEVGGFFVVDRNAWQKEQQQARQKRSFSLFSRQN